MENIYVYIISTNLKKYNKKCSGITYRISEKTMQSNYYNG